MLNKTLRFPPGHPRAGQRCKRVLVACPPQHGKSTLISQLFPAVGFGYDPTLKLILLSYGAELATAHAQVARDHVLNYGQVLRPDGGLVLRTDTRARNNWHTTAGGYLRSASIMGAVTGMAADGLICDDLFKGAEDSASPVMKDKAWATFSSVAETRLSPDGFIVHVGTPWAQDDVRGRLLNTEPDDWLDLRFPALAEEGDVLGRAPGDPLFPERYPLEWYEGVRAKLEMRGLSHLWDALYGCAPTGDASLRAFPAEYFGPWLWVDELPTNPRNAERFRVLALDPSKSKTGKVGDYAAFADVSLLSDNQVYASMHLTREPLPGTYARAVAIVRQAKNEGRPFHRFIIESNQFQEAVGLAIQGELQRAGLDVPIDLHCTPSDQAKHARIQVSLGPLLAQKRLHFVGKTVGNKLTVQQASELPNGTHDDGPDAVEMATQALNLLLTGHKRPPATVIRPR